VRPLRITHHLLRVSHFGLGISAHDVLPSDMDYEVVKPVLLKRSTRTIFLILALCISRPVFAGAAWQAGGVASCTVPGTQETPSVLSLGHDGAIVVWADDRGNDYDIYAQKLDTTGRPLWTAGGVKVCGGGYDQEFPLLVSDGAGGAIVVWQDSRAGDDGTDIYAQRIDLNGNALWQADGVPLCSHLTDLLTTPPSAYAHVVVSDGAGGAIVAWRDTRNSPVLGATEIYAQRVNGAGLAQWTPNGVPVVAFGGQNPWVNTSVVIAPDGSNGAVIAWQDGRNSSTTKCDLYAQRISASGAPMWTSNGVVVCNASGDQAFYSDIVDMSGGSTSLVWEDKRNGTDYDIYAQKLSSDGVPQWTVNGNPVAQNSGDQRTPRAVSDGSGGVVVAWSDSRTNPAAPDIYAQRLNSTGDIQWGASGKPVATAPGWQGRVRMVPSTSGTMMTWMDNRQDPSGVTLYYDIYAQLIDSSGCPHWQADGVPVTASTGTQRLQNVAADGAGGLYTVWEDNRNAGDWDVFGQRVLPTGPIPVENTAVAKTYADLSCITLGPKVVTGVFADCFYIEEPERYSGIKVLPASSVNVGDAVTVTGVLETTCERAIRATSVVNATTGAVPNPLGIIISRLGGSASGFIPAAGGVIGLNNVGLLVRMAGAVVDKGALPTTYFTVSDGTTSVRVLGSTTSSIGDFVCVTGICSCDSGQTRVLLRTSADVQVVK
jgi:hypothetical protein